MKFQLDFKALEWLYKEGGEEFKLELQSSVVQAFASKYLKGLINSELIGSLRQEMVSYIVTTKTEIELQLKEKIGTMTYQHGEYRLINIHPDVRGEIAKIVNERLDAALGTLIDQSVGEIFSPERIETRVNRIIAEKVNAQLTKEIREQARVEILAKLAKASE